MFEWIYETSSKVQETPVYLEKIKTRNGDCTLTKLKESTLTIIQSIITYKKFINVRNEGCVARRTWKTKAYPKYKSHTAWIWKEPSYSQILSKSAP